MPLVANTALPSYKRFQREGGDVVSLEKGIQLSDRGLHVGLMNMMPDAALEPTERQFIRLLGRTSSTSPIFVYPFCPHEIIRGPGAQQHISQYYFSFNDLQDSGLDALIISGANPEFANIVAESFWEPLCKVLDWAKNNISSTLCACLASHAAMLHFYGIERIPLSEKCWGVFQHKVTLPHPIVKDMKSPFDVPHSRWNKISRQQMEDVGIRVLAESSTAGVHLATSPDGCRFIFFQGHPEYDHNSLLKEYKREVNRFIAEERDDYPQVPANYFSESDIDVLSSYERAARVESQKKDSRIAEFPEDSLYVNNTWRSAGEVVFGNWLTLVNRITGTDRKAQFNDDALPEDPLSGIV
ncbi:MAG: homoserine O-succinyltransferase [Acidiferrobacteraceae bacterium]|nr:homoserine O-succinyltransferase [Acidiferrobacteraceae bacterium]|tara:strand:- start:100 stop:1164 length:1065 start_codon:yes stop_codon:yes gene_type:complete